MLTIVHRMAVYVSVLAPEHPAGVTPPAEAAAPVRAAAAKIAAAYEAAADKIEAGEPPTPEAGAALRESVNSAASSTMDGTGEELLRALDGWAWLHGLVDDLALLQQAFAPQPLTKTARPPASGSPPHSARR